MSHCRALTRNLGPTLALTLLLGATSSVQANSKIYHTALRSTGWLVVSKDNGQLGVATCWVVDQKKKHAITNHHVVREAADLKVSFPKFRNSKLLSNSWFYYHENEPLRARVLTSDSKRDLALLQLEEMPKGIAAVPLAKQPIQTGQTVHTVGNSGSAGKKIDEGTLWKYLTNKVRKIFFTVKMMDGKQRMETRVIETKLGVRPGDSGGPLLNDAGELVGVVSAYSLEEPGIDYSVDLGELKEFLARAYQPKVVTQMAVQGTWTLLFQHEGQEKCLGLTMRVDGSCLLDGEKRFPGRFQYQENQLTLQVPGLGINEQVAVNWVDGNQFRFVSSGTEFTATRR